MSHAAIAETLQLPSWHKTTSSKDILAVLAWILVSLETRDDMLLSNLEGMAYSSSSSSSNAEDYYHNNLPQ